MEEKLIALIFCYMKNKLDIDSKFVNGVIKIAREYYDLSYYLKGVKPVMLGNRFMASYCMDNKKVLTNVRMINERINMLYSEFHIIDNSLLFRYMYVIYILFHEVEHAYQQKLVKECNDMNNIESLILKDEQFPLDDVRCCDFLYKFIIRIEYKAIYDKYYLYSPSERFADIKSFELCLNIINMLENKNIYNIFEYFKDKRCHNESRNTSRIQGSHCKVCLR